ncbi:MAG TPA: 2,3-bisphosphoglycerate-independent phosphoglycerate mutase, partial [Acidiferrobacterales bacterium]|nr:2,3-bisphosphoglycerate-independent phosphoglycerate mutase [Acidiferrobacterales bacterium]
MSAPPKPLMLIVMDGWGYRENPEHNAIAKARKPTWDYFWQNYPHTLIHASEAAVGLPSNQMGNSEVGHLNIGAGRVVYQEYTRINRAIGSGTFFTNKTLTDAVDLAVSTGKAVHILGLLSPGGVHSHEEQIHAMAELAVKRGAKQLYLHAFLDGRDTPPRSAAASIKATEEKFAALGQGRIASIIGRYYAMDRDHRWPRIQAAYDLITQGKAEHTATTASEGLELAYARGESDEFVAATTIVPHRDAPMPRVQDAQERLPPGDAQGSASVAGGTTPGMEEVGPRREQRPRTPGATGAPVRILDGDVVVFMNFRSDRARQITRPFIEENFDGFERAAWPRLGRFVSLTEYQSEFHVPCAFPPERLRNVLGEYLAAHGIHQLRIAETEKYAHVTFFFNGGEETPFKFEDRILVPSPTDVPTYNQKPEMSAPLV